MGFGEILEKCASLFSSSINSMSQPAGMSTSHSASGSEPHACLLISSPPSPAESESNSSARSDGVQERIPEFPRLGLRSVLGGVVREDATVGIAPRVLSRLYTVSGFPSDRKIPCVSSLIPNKTA